jgi:chromosome segregation ATPase
MIEYSEYFVLGIALVIGAISWMLKKEHARIESLEGDYNELNNRLSKAIKEIALNSVEDKGWRKHVEANHKGLQKADEDRRNDTRKIYDKIEATHEKIQRLAEKIAGK